MSYKSQFHDKIYSGNIRNSPHGIIIGWISKRLKKYSIASGEVFLKYMFKGKRVLDMGSGDGGFCIKLQPYFEEVYGMDISSERIQKAKRRAGKKHSHYVCSDIDSKFPFRSLYFDAVTSIATIQYCFDPYFTLGETARVLKKGGKLYLQVTNIAWIVYRLHLLFGKQFNTSSAYFYGWDGGVLHYFTHASLTGLIRKEGFKIETISCSGIFRGIKMLWPQLLASDIIIVATKK